MVHSRYDKLPYCLLVVIFEIQDELLILIPARVFFLKGNSISGKGRIPFRRRPEVYASLIPYSNQNRQ
jgi:hypothetical protein